MRVSGYMSVCVCVPVLEGVYVCLSVCVCACTVCVCVLYWPYNNQTVFTKIGKTRKYLRLLLSSFFPHFPLLPRSSSVASGAYAFFITYTYTCWIPLRPLTPPLSFVPLFLHVSLNLYLCRVRRVLCKTWESAAAYHASISTSCGGNSCHFPHATCHCFTPPPPFPFLMPLPGLSVGASAASANKNVKYLRTVDIPAQSGSSGGVWQMPR